jgi:hypothetical protein
MQVWLTPGTAVSHFADIEQLYQAIRGITFQPSMFQPSAGLLLSDSLHHAFDRLEFSFYYRVGYEAVSRSPIPRPSSFDLSEPCRMASITFISSWPSPAQSAGNITAKHSDRTAFGVA